MVSVKESSLKEVFTNRIVVPDYQRPYSWEKEQIEDFYYDLVSFLKKDSDTYLFGQIIVYEDETQNSITTYNIVDGQQRMSTSIILLNALRDYINANNITIAKSTLNSLDNATGIYDEGDNTLTLIMNKEDQHFFFEYVQQSNHTIEPESPSNKRIKDAYELLYNHLADSEEENKSDFITRMIVRFLNNFKVIFVQETNLEKAYVIFETLNSRGKPLEVQDLLKTLTR